MTLYYFLQSAADQAERVLAAAREDGGSSVS
jgi:hypothetical protein